MNTFLKAVMTIFIVLLTTGCATVEHQIVYKTKVIAPDDDMLLNCDISAPPDQAEYNSTNMKGREKLLADTNSKNIKNLSVCNKRIDSIRVWKTRAIAAIAEEESKATPVVVK